MGAVGAADGGDGAGYGLYIYDYRERGLSETDLANEIENRNSEIQASIDIEKGPLMKAGLFRTDEADHLMLCIHHLAVDAVSWRILIEDLETGYRLRMSGREIKLGAKTASYKAWSEALKEYAGSDELMQEAAYWERVTEKIPEPLFQKTISEEKGMGAASFSLDKDDAEKLLYESCKAFGAEINDLLISGLGITLGTLSGRDNICVNLEGHGRETIHKRLETDQTMGWFTSIYPVIINLGKDVKETIILTKEMLRKIPNKGLGYGVLKYLSGVFPEREEAGITFNYLGKIDAEITESPDGVFRVSEYSAGLSVAPENSLKGALTVNCIVSGGTLNIEVLYRKDRIAHEEAKRFGEVYLETLKGVIDICAGQAEAVKTSSDYWLDDERLAQAELEEILGADVEKIYGLTPLQEGMLYQNLLNESSTEFIIQLALQYRGLLEIEIVRQSLDLLSVKHEALRTAFITTKAGHSWQTILRDRKIELYLTHAEDDAETEAQKKADVARGFDLKNDSLLRVGVICKKDGESVILWTIHHIIMDGWCLSLLYGDFYGFYKKLLNGYSYETLLKEIKKEKSGSKSYQDYIHILEKKDKEAGLKYWEQLLDGYSEAATVLPIQAEETGNEVERLSRTINEQLGKKLRNFAQHENITINSIAEAAWGIILQKYNRTDDVVFGKVVSGRNAPIKGIESIVGLFINTVPVRVRNDKDTTIRDLIKAVYMQSVDCAEFDHCPLVEIQSRSSLGRNLFNTLFAFENYYFDESVFGTPQKSEADVTVLNFREQTNYSLTASAYYDDRLRFDLMYDPRVYGKTEVEFILRRIEMVLSEIAESPDKTIREIDIIEPYERRRILYEFNDAHTKYPRDKTIPQLFEEQAAKNPDNIALIYNDESMTYGGLNAKSNQLACRLREKGVAPDGIVGIMVERSFEMIVGIMGILKAGGAYMPIDPEYPNERIRFMLEDSGAEILLTQSWLNNRIQFRGEKMNLDEAWIYEGDAANPAPVGGPCDLAYVIYTSGSSGRPKGVKTEHQNLYSLVKYPNYTDIRPDDIILQLSNYVFDGSVFDIYGALLNGAKLVLVSKTDSSDMEKLSHIILEQNISMFLATTALFNTLVEYEIDCFKNVRRIFFGGETSSYPHVKKALNYMGKNKAVHVYGPTENTVFSTSYCVNDIEDAPTAIPIGKPLANYQAYILNADNQLSPIGVSGELCISGEGVARGYLNRPELTAEKFVDNPFIPGARMYRTGDLARWRTDGNIEFLGRIDQQVKIRGFRVELEEIESRLLEIESIKEAVVIAHEDDSHGKYLCAYIVADEEIPPGELRRKLSENLPDYMVPLHFVKLEKLPLTRNGKIDRRALPAPERSSEAQYCAPSNNMEEKLAGIYCEVLARERVGINDNFFDLGGHSLKAMAVISKIHKELNVEIPLRELFKNPTIKGLGDYITGAGASPYSAIEPVETKEYYETSSAQKRMWLLQQYDIDSMGYNIPSVMIIDGRLDTNRMESAFSALGARHEAIRTSFDMIDGEIVQRIAEQIDFNIEYSVSCEEEIDEKIKGFIRPFDLSKAPLLRIGLIKTSESRSYLLFDMHHIVSDGVSVAVLTREFTALYEGCDLKPQRIQYKDFSEWQNKFIKSQNILEQEKYWMERFSNDIPVLNLPLDYARPAIQSFEGGNAAFLLDRDLTERLNNLARETGATLYMVLLSAISILLSKYTGQKDVIVGSPIAGRPHADLENIIGMFVNTLAMRNYPAGGKTYVEFLNEVKENALKAYENQDYQFEELVDKLNLRRDLSRNPLFDVMFALQNMEMIELEIEGLKFSGYEIRQAPAKFDLTFMAKEAGDEIVFDLQYCSALFKRGAIERMSEHLRNLLKAITEDKTARISDIGVLSEEERNKVLYEFNNTHSEYPRDKTIHRLFEEQAAKNPDNIALIYNNESMTYGELNAKSNQLARRLREKGVVPDGIVGIMAERSFGMIVGIMGILKAGGAYLPIDIEYPNERIRFMLEDSGAEILLTQSWLNSRIQFGGEKMNLDEAGVYEGDASDPAPAGGPCDLAYVIYTSGSSGNPKGVKTEHQNVYSIVKNTNYTDIRPNDVILQLSNYAFDGSVFDIYGALLNGLKLVLVSKADSLDIAKLSQIIHEQNISMFFTTTALFNTLIDYETDCFKNVRKVFFGGEASSVSHVKKALTYMGKNRVVHVYGPTENTVFSTYYCVNEIEDAAAVIPIGKPMANYQTYILNADNQPSPIGVSGELCISGDGVARGYLNRPELTAEKFVDNPYIPGARMYRTGDLARWRPDGNIEFLGRIDQQIKIRGFRVELGEIESRLLEIESIKETVVIAGEDGSGDKYLCAYVVSDKDIPPGELRRKLSENLPEYMVPQYFVRLERLPLTLNGKIDKRALPAPEGGSGIEFVAPRTVQEANLAKAFSEILGNEKIGALDNFFELGGDSIKAIRIISKLREAGYELSVRDLLMNPVVEKASEKLKTRDEGVLYEQGEVTGESPLTPVQRWFFASGISNINHFNQAIMLKSVRRIDINGLTAVLGAIVKHHDILRAVYRDNRQVLLESADGVDGANGVGGAYGSSGANGVGGAYGSEGVGGVGGAACAKGTGGAGAADGTACAKGAGYSLFVFDYRDRGLSETDLANEIEDKNSEIQASIDIEKGPLMKAGLFRTEEADHLMVCIHHLAVDGVSWRIFVEDLETGYRQWLSGAEIKFNDKTASYKAWSEALIEYSESDELRQEAAYWERIVKRAPESIFRETVTEEKGMGAASFTLGKDDAEKLLYQSGKAFGTEINDLLISGLGIAFGKLTGSDNMCVNLEGHGRETIHRRIDIDRTMGWFTSIYPVIINLGADVRETIIQTKETLRKVPNKGMGYGALKYLSGVFPEREKVLGDAREEAREKVLRDAREDIREEARGKVRGDAQEEVRGKVLGDAREEARGKVRGDAQEEARGKVREEADVAFNYLGSIDAEITGSPDGIFKVSEYSVGVSVAPENLLKEALTVNCIVSGGTLNLDVFYRKDRIMPDEAKRFGEAYLEALKDIINVCAGQVETVKTSSDYGLDDERLALTELDEILDVFN
ncbi:MAG: amino acid adenylation domain-containing protein [Oscillospiraceae bacterium]|nr:amino acid adenylation domain-containing protein [Oscillospiraceae bacterium]